MYELATRSRVPCCRHEEAWLCSPVSSRRSGGGERGRRAEGRRGVRRGVGAVRGALEGPEALGGARRHAVCVPAAPPAARAVVQQGRR